MNLPLARSRIRLSARAALTGWAVAVALTLPMQFWKIYTVTVGGWRPLLWSLAMGSLLWAVWMLLITAAAWLGGCLPLLAIVPERLLLRHRGRAVVISALLGWSIVLVKFKIWYALLPDHPVVGVLFTLYSVALTLFAVVTTAVYLRLLGRRVCICK